MRLGISSSFILLAISLALPVSSQPKGICTWKETAFPTIYQLLPESKRSCLEILQRTFPEGPNEEQTLSPEYKTFFLAICEGKKLKSSEEDLRRSLGLLSECKSALPQ